MTEKHMNSIEFETMYDTTSHLVAIQLHNSAINRRDDWICKGAYPNIQHQVTLGSDGCGTIVSIHKNGSVEEDIDLCVGQQVCICPSMNWGEREDIPHKNFHILGMPSDGTFSQNIVVPYQNVFPIPSHLRSVEAAALPLAGLTAYRALMTKGQLQKGNRVLVTGIGGGVAVFVLQFAVALGAEVYVTSSSQEKIDKAISMGAKGGALYTSSNWTKSLPKHFDVVVDSAGGQDFGSLISLIGMGGRIVFFGGTNGTWPPIKPQHLFFKQASILATTMGSPREFLAMCQLVEQYQIIPIVDSVFSLWDHHAAFERLLDRKRFGKIVFEHSKF